METTATEVAEVTESGEKFDISILWNKLVDFATNTGGKLIGAILLLIVGAIIIRLVMKAIRKSKFVNRSDSTVAHFLVNFIKVILDALLIISVIGILGVPLTSVVAIVTSAGVTVGLALQGALSNLAGGIMILIFKPFRLGDYISTTGHEGTVKDIGIFYTVLATVDNREVTIPNGTIMGASIINVSAYDTRRVDLVFSVAYGTDVARVNTIILEEAKKHELALTGPEPFCRLSAEAASALEFTLRVWCKKEDYWQVHFDLTESIHNKLVEEGIEIPFQQVDVHIRDQQ